MTERSSGERKSLASYASQDSATRAFCLYCHHHVDLTVSEPWYCTHCRRPYVPNAPATYLADRRFAPFRFWLPGFCLALVSGVTSYGIGLQTGELGLALFFAVPVSFGAILGFSVRCPLWVASALMLAVVVGVVCALVTVDLSGFFCGLMLIFVFTLPAFLGMVLGWLLRVWLKGTDWEQRVFLPLALLVLLPYIGQAIEVSLAPGFDVATVRTSLTLDATPADVWDALMFYEEVEAEPPWLLRLALPRPVGSFGDKTREGQYVRCKYDRGHIIKRIRQVDKHRKLGFEVVEQQLHFEKDIQLLDGAFTIHPCGAGKSTIVLTTRYQRKLTPPWLWQPIETEVVRTLHLHVLQGMAETVRKSG